MAQLSTFSPWLTLASFAWLVPLAVYDLRHRTVPHMALVLVPCLAAVAYALWRGL